MNTPKKHKGALGELEVTCWLLKQGYEVFRNVSPFGAADIISRNPSTGELTLIDVKTKNSTCTDNFLRKFNRTPGVRIVSYLPDTGEIKYET